MRNQHYLVLCQSKCFRLFIGRMARKFDFRETPFLFLYIQSHIQHIFLFIMITSMRSFILTNYFLNWMANCYLNNWWLKQSPCDIKVQTLCLQRTRSLEGDQRATCNSADSNLWTLEKNCLPGFGVTGCSRSAIKSTSASTISRLYVFFQ